MKKRLVLGALGVTALGLSAAVYASTGIDGVRVSALLKERLPNTQVSSVDCSKVSGLCEVVAGKTLFYTDESARYLFVGRLYDMETRQDLTAAKLLEVNPDMLVGGALAAAAGDGQPLEAEEKTELSPAANARGGLRAAAIPAGRPKVDVSKLPSNGAVVWGKAGGKTLTIFTDFRCGYCRMLVAQLEKMNVRVVERPISALGSRDLSEQVICSKNKVAAAKDAYAGLSIEDGGKCDTSGLDANEAFARQNGFMGTPMIVRSDGEVLEGYRPREFLESWINDAR